MEKKIEQYFDRLFPICRSLTGDGVRETLRILQEVLPLEIHEVRSGTKAFDWTVPKEWNIKGAYIKEVGGKVICDFADNNLHVVSYSTPVNEVMDYDTLVKKLHYLEELPDAIPYFTSYYKEDWGFCMSYNAFKELDKTKRYEVVIDSSLTEGSMTYGEVVLKGETEKEVLFSTYICHPSMANNELSGVLVNAFLYGLIAQLPKRKYTYRFVFVPETIGSIYYLSKHGEHFRNNLIAGLILTCIGDRWALSYKHSRRGNALVDKIMKHVMFHDGMAHELYDFTPLGSDERQYCSPGFNLPVGVLCRSMFHTYKQYHTSLDNKSIISFDVMVETLETLVKLVKAIELNDHYINTQPFCEPQMGKRGLYHSVGGMRTPPDMITKYMTILNYCDGEHDLVDIAEKLKLNVLELEESVQRLLESGLLRASH
jgi:aminopeptidase-like protein